MEAEWKDIKTYPSWYLLQRIYRVVKSKWFCWKGLICDHLFWWTASSSPIWYNIDSIGCVADCLAAFRSHTQEEDWSTKRLPHSLEFMHTYQLFRKLMLWIRLVSCVYAMHVATRSYQAKEHCPQPHIETTSERVRLWYWISNQIWNENKIKFIIQTRYLFVQHSSFSAANELNQVKVCFLNAG